VGGCARVASLALTRSAITLHDLERGVTIDGVMTAQLALNDPRYDDPHQMVRTTTAIVERWTDRLDKGRGAGELHAALRDLSRDAGRD